MFFEHAFLFQENVSGNKKEWAGFLSFQNGRTHNPFFVVQFGNVRTEAYRRKKQSVAWYLLGKTRQAVQGDGKFFTEHNNLMKYRRHGKKFMSCSPMIQSNEGRKGGGLRFEATPLQADKGF